MGLVQASEKDIDQDRSFVEEGITLIWDKQVDNMTRFYGGLIVDYVRHLSGGRFIVAFSGASSC